MTVETTVAAMAGAAALAAGFLLTWRCGGCRRIVAKLQYDGRAVIEVRHTCNSWNRLPDDIHRLRLEDGR